MSKLNIMKLVHENIDIDVDEPSTVYLQYKYFPYIANTLITTALAVRTFAAVIRRLFVYFACTGGLSRVPCGKLAHSQL